jgi:hypothetical protein
VREHLPALTAKIKAALATKLEVFITHPAELRILSSMSEDELRKFAAEPQTRRSRYFETETPPSFS